MPDRRAEVTMSDMDDTSILSHIHDLIGTERELQSRTGHSPDERARLREIEHSLDQCWDLLRQRRARREFGENPDDAHARPVGEIRSYLQ